MNRHRRGGGAPFGGEGSSSDDDEDAFAALSKKGKFGTNKKLKTSSSLAATTESATKQQPTPVEQPSVPMSSIADSSAATEVESISMTSTTTAVKRHHGAISDTRKAKMDALLLELQQTNAVDLNSAKQQLNSDRRQVSQSQQQPMIIPDKKGSFVEPGEEHITTNIFVGNLAPSITEEEMTELFRQFGDLYSVKIMWPRTAEERMRNRHTGFVCFMNRSDAEDAMEACSESDPFNVGRRLLMRWGKNVKKIVKRGTGGIPIAPILQRKSQKESQGEVTKSTEVEEKPPVNNEADTTQDHSKDKTLSKELNIETESNSQQNKATVCVVIPTDPLRAHFITTVASFVAKDGYQLERAILQKESMNTSSDSNEFDFLTLPPAPPTHFDTTSYCPENDNYQRRMQEHQYYKWRVYSFCHGDGYYKWRTDPFIMFHPFGCKWVPPPIIDSDAAVREEMEIKRKEDDIIRQRKQRRFHNSKREYVTGRQLEHQQERRGRHAGPDSGGKVQLLSPKDMEIFDKLFVQELCAARNAICEAMAFCFEKSFAASEISNLLRDLLMVSDPTKCSIDTMIARIFLLSDVLYNAQQPGVRNAFYYRDAIHRISPEIFANLGGVYKSNLPGRMSQERLTTAFNAVLAAWTNWGVFDSTFLDELDARYKGKEITSVAIKGDTETIPDDGTKIKEQVADASHDIVVYDKPTGKWEAVAAEPDESDQSDSDSFDRKHTGGSRERIQFKVDENTRIIFDSITEVPCSGGNKEETVESRILFDKQKEDSDLQPEDKLQREANDGKPIIDQSDGELDPDGEPIDDDPDGAPIDEDDPDGEAVDGEPMDADDEPVDEDPDGESIDDDPDGEPIDEELDIEHGAEGPDGEPIDDGPHGQPN